VEKNIFRFMFSIRIIVAILSAALLSSCGNNLHYTLGLSSLSVDFDIPATISAGQTVSVIGGSCAPNGAANIGLDSSPSGDFSPAPLTCDCANGVIVNCVDGTSASVANIVFSGNGPNGATPNLVATITDEEGNSESSNPVTVINPEVDLTGPLTAVVGAPAAPLNVSGTCNYPGSNPTADVTITDASGSMSPSSVSCVCNGPGAGTLDCSAAPNVTFSSSDPILTASIDDGLNTTTDATPVTVNVDPIVDLTSPVGGPFNVGDNIPLQGTCMSDGDSVSIPNPGPGNMSPAGPLTCTCGSTTSGQFDCGSYQLTSFGTSPNFTATISDSDGDTANDSETATTVGPSFTVTKALSRINGVVSAVGANVLAGDVLEFSVGVSNSGMGAATNVQISDGCPANAPANGTFNPGTGTYAAGTWTVASLAASGGSDTLTFECVVNNGLSSGSVDNTITSVSSAETGASAVSGVSTTNPIVAPTVDLTTGLSPSGPGVSTTLPANMGTCSPNGGSVSLSDANSSMSANPVTCTCSSGAIDCSANSVTFTSEDADLSATITANGAGPFTDSTPGNDPDIVMSPTITLGDLDSGGTLTDNDTFGLSGTCQSEGDVINIPDPGPVGLYTWPTTATDGSCTCSSGTYNCGTVTVVDASQGPSGTVTATITDQDGAAPQETASASDTPMVAAPGFTLVKSVSPTGNIYAGNTVTYTLSLTNGSVATSSVSLSDNCPSPMTASGVPTPSTGTYTGGTWTIGSMAVSANETLSFDCLVPNGTSPQTLTNSVTSVAANGSSYTPGGTTSVSNDVVDPTLDLTTGPAIPAGGGSQTLPNNMGTCAPNGAAVTLSSSQMSPTTATCSCSSGVIDCSSAAEGPFTFGTADASFTATVTNGGVGPIADSTPGNDPSVNINPVITVTDDSDGPFSVGDAIDVTGACERAGDSITVPSPSPGNLTPANLSCSCSGAPGSFDCGDFTVASKPASDPTFTATITDSDGDTSTDTSTIGIFQDVKQTYAATGAEIDVTVPSGAKTVTIKAWGAGGGGGRVYSNVFNRGAAGAFTNARFNVSALPSPNLKVVVGTGGAEANNAAAQTNAFLNGGAAGPGGACTGAFGAGGGGLVGVFTDSVTQANALLISGSAGGASDSNGNSGSGNISKSGAGGTQSIPATGGDGSVQDPSATGGSPGSLGAGGSGGSGSFPGGSGSALAGGDSSSTASQCSAGGGAGYFGGGGGGNAGGAFDAAGGGGSGFVAAIGTILSEAVSVDLTAPNNADPDYVTGVATGGERGVAGGDGLIILIWE